MRSTAVKVLAGERVRAVGVPGRRARRARDREGLVLRGQVLSDSVRDGVQASHGMPWRAAKASMSHGRIGRGVPTYGPSTQRIGSPS
jgi:hypothetical protein